MYGFWFHLKIHIFFLIEGRNMKFYERISEILTYLSYNGLAKLTARKNDCPNFDKSDL